MSLTQAIITFGPMFQEYLALTNDADRDAMIERMEDATEELDFDVAEQLYMHFGCA